MHPLLLAGAVLLGAYLVVRRRKLSGRTLALGAAAVVALAVFGAGLVPLPDFHKLIQDVGRRLGKWTYVFVGLLAFLETGAFVGLIAPGETAVLVGGVVAGQGQISIGVLIAVVWICAVLGDLTSFLLGRRLGREWLVRHGDRVKITERRLAEVERFFERHGGTTIVVGRFIGLVRALAPFIAGTSGLPLRRFVPYDVLGAGLWSALFCTLGYVFWQSFDQVTKYAGRGAFVVGAIAAMVALGLWIRRLRRDPSYRARVATWIDERPALAKAVRWVWPVVRRLERPARFAYDRLTPGQLGLELTTLLALAVVGFSSFFLLAEQIHGGRALPLDAEAFDVAGAVYGRQGHDVMTIVTVLGAFSLTVVAAGATALWLALRRRVLEAVTLTVAYAVSAVAVPLAKAAEGRPRPLDPHVVTDGLSYPSGHAAHAVALVACAVLLVRAGHRGATRFAAVAVAIAAMVVVALSRVYLRAHYLSDTLGGVALGVAIFALCGVVALVVATIRDNPGTEA
jgi:membrane protein DedA with SNARE-associated domain/membrane-associated phospholipid phosphatase